MIDNNETTFPNNLLLLDRQVSYLHKALANNLLVNRRLSKSQLLKLSTVSQISWYTSWTINESLVFTDEECTKPVDQKCVDTIWIQASALDAGVSKKILGYRTSGSDTTALIIAKE